MNDDTRVATKREQAPASGDASGKTPMPALRPPVDVIEDSGGITLYADLPGVPKENLTLQLDAESLVIEASMALDTPEAMESGHAEIDVPRYRRVFTLSRELESDKATAEFRNGVLKLRIPKAAHAQPRKIEINAG